VDELAAKLGGTKPKNTVFGRDLVGRVIKDYGPLQERKLGLQHSRTSLWLGEQGSDPMLVFRYSGSFLCFGRLYSCKIPIDKTDVLRRSLDDVDEIVAAKFGGTRSTVQVKDLA
jgi:hypothetical protein